MVNLRGYADAAALNKPEAGWIAMAANDPALAPRSASQARDMGKVEAFLLVPAELLGDLPLERRAMGSMLRHGFHSPEAQQGGQFKSHNLSTLRGALQNLESFARCFT